MNTLWSLLQLKSPYSVHFNINKIYNLYKSPWSVSFSWTYYLVHLQV
jgi:hypothetical protein